MALQGTLETFSVPEVLRLLSSTRKTGLMALGGDRGMGKVWLHDGQIVAAESDEDRSDAVDGVLFDLLRFKVGEFVFEPETTPTDPGEPVDVEVVLGQAESLLAEWKELESVVPSLDVGVRMRPEIDAPVTVTTDQWRSLVAIGAGTSAAAAGRMLDLGELEICRLVRDLVEAGLVEVSDAPVESAPEPTPATVEETLAAAGLPNGTLAGTGAETPAAVGESEAEASGPQLVDHDLSSEEVADLSSNLASFVARPEDVDDAQEGGDAEAAIDLTGTDEHAEEVPPADTLADTPADTADPAPAAVDDAWGEDEPGEAAPTAETAAAEEPGEDHDGSADDFLAQLSNLSPKAAAAIEATSDDAEDPNGADAGDAEPGSGSGEAGDEEINRSLLLKFLSSTKN